MATLQESPAVFQFSRDQGGGIELFVQREPHLLVGDVQRRVSDQGHETGDHLQHVVLFFLETACEGRTVVYVLDLVTGVVGQLLQGVCLLLQVLLAEKGLLV